MTNIYIVDAYIPKNAYIKFLVIIYKFNTSRLQPGNSVGLVVKAMDFGPGANHPRGFESQDRHWKLSYSTVQFSSVDETYI